MAPLYAQVLGCSAIACVATVAYLAARYEIFRKPKWEIGQMEGFTYVYVKHVGSYNTIGKSFEKLRAELAEAGMDVSWDRHRFVGVYLDDPKEVPAGECRARAGVILDDEAAATCALPSMTYKTQETAQTQLPYFDFPSVLIAVSKAYPAFCKFCDSQGVDGNQYDDMIELYDRQQRTVTFHAIKSKK